jgi:subtilisin family serine protease
MKRARKRKVSSSSTSRKRSTLRRTRSPNAATPKLPPPSTLRMQKLGIEKAALGAKSANTIIYVHGIGNKPPAAVLKCQWDKALLGVEQGDRSRMAYWVNRELYPTPLDETCSSGDQVRIDDDEMSTRTVLALSTARARDSQHPVEREIKALTDDPVRQSWLTKIATKLIAGTVVSNEELHASSIRAKVLPLPEPFRRLISQNLTRAFLRDVNDFLFDAERRDAMERSLLDRLVAGGGPFIIIAHSQGSMIAYDVLRRIKPPELKIPLFITIGSPLGLEEVQDALRQWTGGSLPFPPCVDRWLNVADRLDPVAFDNDISDDFDGAIENVSGIGLNKDSPRHPHSATGYLVVKDVVEAVRKVIGSTFEQEIGSFTIAKDLVGDLENAHRGDRHPTLIQLAREGQGNSGKPAQVRVIAESVKNKLTNIIEAAGDDPADAEFDDLRHFVAAKLTRLEVETLGSFFDDLKFVGIWRNARKRALISASTHTIQARPANLGYGADGIGVCWALLDTGIRADHPHFQKHSNVVAQWDCTHRGDPRLLERGSKEFNQLDGDGHGTHVSGIIAGEGVVNGVTYAGMAPRTSLCGFKVLNDQGEGEDAWIIKALDTVAGLNEKAGSLVVQGVNLSLGGGFDPSVFGCGHTPLCQELRRLWRQGVLVVLAAGNEGYAVLKSEDGDIQSNIDLSIGDPANLDEAIAVGSVHKTNPHTYGISYFSSRGPTADGRKKPDVVAPGEKIVSARHDWKDKKTPTVDDLYVEQSGTSMAAPHVSGLLAAFLSLRREFIGYPDRAKSLLLNGCVDLARDPYMQGAGLPNLIKMLALN